MDNSADPILSRIGQFGRWQAKTISVVSLVGFFSAYQMLAFSFMVTEKSFWCSPSGLSLPLGQNISWVSPTQPNETSVDHCKMFDIQYGENTNVEDIDDNANITDCKRWDFDRSVPETVVSQFSLVCSRDIWRSLTQSVYMVGKMVGAVGSGFLSDRFGRQRMLVISSIGMMVFGISVSFSPSMEVFVFLRWCVAVFGIALYSCGFVYCMEMVGGRWSTYIGIGLVYPWAIGYMSLPLLAWIFPSWSSLQLAISVPVVILSILLVIPGLVPESPRWLLAKGHTEQANQILTKAEKVNQNREEKELTETPVSKDKDQTVNSSTILDLFRTPYLRRSTLIMYYLWFTNSFVYYGLTLNSGSLFPGSLHINFIIGGALEILAYTLTILAFIYTGRKFSVSFSMLFGGIALLLTSIVPSITGKAVLGQLGKFAITASFSMVYVYAAEIFPTVIRNTGIGSSSFVARIGSIFAPFIGRELGKKSPAVPLIIFGLTSVIAGILVLFLPETRNSKLVDTIEEGEVLSREFGGLKLWRGKEKKEESSSNQVYEQKVED